MGILDDWPFKSREKQKEEEAALRRLAFPFGEEHREKLFILLETLVGGKMSREEKMFCYLSAKQLYAKAGEEALGEVEKTLRRLRMKDPNDRRAVIALLQIDTALPSLDAFPSVEAVQARAALAGWEG